MTRISRRELLAAFLGLPVALAAAYAGGPGTASISVAGRGICSGRAAEFGGRGGINDGSRSAELCVRRQPLRGPCGPRPPLLGLCHAEPTAAGHRGRCGACPPAA